MQTLAALVGFEWGLQWKIYVLRIMSASIPAAIALVLLWLSMLRVGAEPRRALFAVVVVFFGSWWFGYSTLAMPYSPGIAACLGALWLLLYSPGHRMLSSRAFAVGLLCGFALICDFIFGLMVMAIAVVFLTRLANQPAGERAGRLAIGAFGGALPLTIFVAYTYVIFGEPSIPYQFEALPLFKEEMSKGFMGISWPKAAPLWFLTFHPYRGAFFWAPWIVIALAGCVMATRHGGVRRVWGWTGLWAFASYLLFNSGYYMWWGGGAMGPRLMLPMMAALPMGLAEVCRSDRSPAWWRVLVAAGVVSMALCVPVSLIDPQTQQDHTNEELMDAAVGTGLGTPQFNRIRRYYSGAWFVGQQTRELAIRALAPIGLTIGAFILVVAARRLPRGGNRQSLIRQP
jgi:hypothetical protein